MDTLTIRRTGIVINTAVDVTSHRRTRDQIFQLVEQGRPAYVCFATAHMLVEASRRDDIGFAYRGASIVNPDGTPIAWCLKMMGYRDARCVNGPTNTPILLRGRATRDPGGLLWRPSRYFGSNAANA